MSLHYARHSTPDAGVHHEARCIERDCPFEYCGYDYQPTKNHVTENDHRVEVQVTNTQLWVPVPQG